MPLSKLQIFCNVGIWTSTTLVKIGPKMVIFYWLAHLGHFFWNSKHLISTRGLASLDQARSHFPHNIQISYEYLIICQSQDCHAQWKVICPPPPQKKLCWLFNIEWLSYFEHIVQSMTRLFYMPLEPRLTTYHSN